ncbi:MAG: AraC family transcriptional regulator [Pseudomonadota bacterium]
MLLIPFPFLTTAVLVSLLLAMRVFGRTRGSGLSYTELFFTMAALQSLLLGLRHGYGVQALAALLPVTAVLLPPLAYASFVRPAFSLQLWPHLVPAVLIFLAWRVFPPAIDIGVPLVFLTYAALLARRGVGSESDMPWARLGDILASRVALWTVVVALLVSALSDIAIVIDFGRTGGANLGGIMLLVQGFTLVAVAILLWRSVPQSDALSTAEADGAPDVVAMHTDFSAVARIVREQSLYLDPDLNLQRLARKVGVPAKRVSAAVNAVEGVNVSLWVNRLRVAHAQALLSSPEQRVTDAIYSSGFNTKSSFNREFKRITGMTPSAWRSAHAKSST